MANPEDKRLEPRIAATFKVKYQSLDQFLIEYTEDLSRGGMFLVTRNFLPLNSVIRCVLSLPGNEEEIRIIGRVAHILTESEAQQRMRKAGMGIEFLDIPREDADRLLGYLSRMTTGKHGAREGIPGHLRKKREAELLVVDDQPAYLEQVTNALGRAGFKIRTGENGIHGLAQLLRKPPDLVLSDVEMPQMDGWALLRMVRARASLAHIPFVFLTSLGDEAERLRGYRMGVDDYITKPYDLDALAGRLDRLLSRYDQHPRGAMETKLLRGDLDQVSLRSVLVYLEEEKKSGTLLLVRASEQATLYVAEGRIVRASVKRTDLTGPEKVLYTLGWSEGRFEFEHAEVPDGDEIGMSIPLLLAEQGKRGGGGDVSAATTPGSKLPRTVTVVKSSREA